ncbi:MAG TPA: hypothetical protein VMV69_08880 [Pirellulales bacterium]|nr:hypothetical protein [Pirellulales bacterium]
MLKCNLPLAAVPILLVISAPARADDVREYTQGGVTYREVHRTVRAPKTEIQCVERPQTYYQERYDVQLCDSIRTYQVPVTEHRLEPYWRGRFNPFTQPYLTYRSVPRTHWETRTEVVKVPVSTRQLVPVTTTVRVPITTQTVVDQDILVSRSIVGPSIVGPSIVGVAPTSDPFARPAPAMASNQQVGGVHQYPGDPPRRGLVPVTSAGGTRLVKNPAASAPAPRTANGTQGKIAPLR